MCNPIRQPCTWMKDPRIGSPCGIKAFLVDDEILYIQWWNLDLNSGAQIFQILIIKNLQNKLDLNWKATSFDCGSFLTTPNGQFKYFVLLVNAFQSMFFFFQLDSNPSSHSSVPNPNPKFHLIHRRTTKGGGEANNERAHYEMLRLWFRSPPLIMQVKIFPFLKGLLLEVVNGIEVGFFLLWDSLRFGAWLLFHDNQSGCWKLKVHLLFLQGFWFPI